MRKSYKGKRHHIIVTVSYYPWVNLAVDIINVRVVYKHVFIIASIAVLGEHLKHYGRWLKRANVNLSPVIRNPEVEAKSAETENGWADRTQEPKNPSRDAQERPAAENEGASPTATLQVNKLLFFLLQNIGADIHRL